MLSVQRRAWLCCVSFSKIGMFYSSPIGLKYRMSVMAPCLSLDDFHTALTFMPTLISEGSTSPRLWSIPIPGVAPSRSITATSIGVFNRLASVPTCDIEYVLMVPVSLIWTHSSVGLKHCSQYILGGTRIRSQFMHFLAIILPSFSSAKKRLIATPAAQLYLGSNL